MSLLFSPFKIRNMELKNRIMMSPMGTVAADEEGRLTEWQLLHYGARALGQVGLIMLEVTAVEPRGADPGSLGLWNEGQLRRLRDVVKMIHRQNTKVGIQLGHAGRKKEIGIGVSSSGLPFNGKPTEKLTIEQIHDVVQSFRNAAARALQAGIDVIELHAAHGYLINDFLSPITNKRDDQYGGSRENRYRFLKEVIDSVKSVWHGPLFIRVSAEEYAAEGNHIEDYVYFAKLMKKQGIDLIDVSSGGVTENKPKVYPGYQVPYARRIRKQTGMLTAAVGIINDGCQAEEILQNGNADIVAIGRGLLKDPFWPRMAAEQLGVTIEEPKPYRNYWFSKEYTEG